MAFLVFNSAAFAASVVAVMLLTTMNSDPKDKEESFQAVYWFTLVALVGLLFAYGLGSSRKTRSSIHVLCLQLPLLVACILAQFLFQKFCWEHVCELAVKIKGFWQHLKGYELRSLSFFSLGLCRHNHLIL
jgi:hypothetical protein